MRWYNVIGMVQWFLEEKDLFQLGSCSGTTLHVFRLLLEARDRSAELRWYSVMALVEEFLPSSTLFQLAACSGSGRHVAFSCLERKWKCILPIVQDSNDCDANSDSIASRTNENEALRLQEEERVDMLEDMRIGCQILEEMGDSD